MRRFILSTVLAVAAAVGYSGKADAQVVGYNYRTYNPYTSSYINGRMVYTPFGAQNFSAFSNPYYGYGGVVNRYQDPFGNTYGQLNKFNPYTGIGYTSGYYNPGLYTNPLLGYRYGYYYIR